MAINPKWFPAKIRAGTEEDQKKYEQMVRNAATAFARLNEIIEAELRGLEAPKAMSDYDSPGWATKQADRLGQIRSLKNIQTLLELNSNDRR